MSVIGDALRRAEEERCVSAEPSRPVEMQSSAKGIAHEQTWSATADTSSPWMTAALVCLVAAAVGLAVWPKYYEMPAIEARATAPIESPSTAVAIVAPTPAPTETPTDKLVANAVLSVTQPKAEEQEAAPPMPIQRAQPEAKPVAPAVEPRVETATSAISERFRLDGVMLGGQTKLAVVNGMIVEEGQRLDGAIVREIDGKFIVIEIDGQRHRIPMQAGGRRRD